MSEENVLSKNYKQIIQNLLHYLPSRALIILNSAIIIPFVARIMSTKEMSIYLIAMGILNLSCTFSTDWISKAALRFYEKYKSQDRLSEFFSNTFFISVIIYLLIIIIYFLAKNWVSETLAIPHKLLLMTLILIIPCGIRQFLYQMLRVLNKPNFYTFSIFVYQISMLLLFITLTRFIPNTYAILLAMTVSIFLMDIYMIKEIHLNFKIKVKLYPDIIHEMLLYGLPLIVTNVSIWTFLNINKFIFQGLDQYKSTAVIGIAWMFCDYVIKPLCTLFLFAIFPVIIKKFEQKKSFKPLYTNTIQLYCFLYIPIVSLFSYYSKEIIKMMFPPFYILAAQALPFLAAAIFLHEFTKLINIKFHLKNLTYIEMFLTLVIGAFAVGLNFILIPKYSIFGACISIIIPIVLLLIITLFINFKSLDYLDIKKLGKTVFYTVLIGLLCYTIVQFFTMTLHNKGFDLMKMVLFISLYYLTLWHTRTKLLA